jgi:ATP-binding protein involved in chromosome partitioning
MKFGETEILEALKAIVHPSADKDIVSMGLIRDLKLEGRKISFSLSFPSFNDPLKSSIKKACEVTLKEKISNDLEIDISVESNIKPVQPKQEDTPLPLVKNIIAIASGKGGVGKSTVAANLAIAFANTGATVGLIDADIFGPSIPKMLGLENERPGVTNVRGKDLLVPLEKHGVKVLSIGFFVDPQDATVWRGPMASNALKQLMTDANWEELEYLFVDLPPGTSDIHLTLVQSVAVTGAIIVSTPQDIALADVIKGVNMFRNQTINVPVLGLIENMSWFTPEELPDHKYYIFGKEGGVRLAKQLQIPLLGQIPLVQSIREGSDNGQPVVMSKNIVSEAFKRIAGELRLQIIKRNTTMSATNKVEITTKTMSELKNR